VGPQPGDQFPEESVLSGLTVEEVKAGKSPRRLFACTGAEHRAAQIVDPRQFEVMLAEPSDERSRATAGYSS
jgi:hypothetical protein